uniref:Uncharacterized protein n=1 Tax=Arundo donax TaxID=35708 RepID=A0A0A8ZZJ9_ARUDO
MKEYSDSIARRKRNDRLEQESLLEQSIKPG